MVTLLRRLFIKDYQRLEDPTIRAKHGIVCSWCGIVLNALLVFLKLFAAILLAQGNGWVLSFALIGDTLNNSFDILSSVASLIGFRLSRKPADQGHPFGHARAEYLAGVVIGTAIIFSGGTLLIESIKSVLGNASISYDVLSYIALGATIPIKALQSYLNFAMGHLLRSPTLKGVGRDALTDLILSSLLLIGAIVSTSLSWPYLDGYLGSFVSLFLLYAGVRALLEASSALLGEPNRKSYIEDVIARASAHSGVLGVHDVLCHQYGEGVTFLSLHVEVDASMSLIEAHRIADEIEEDLSSSLHASVLVHVDPLDEHADVKKRVGDILSSIDPRISCHDIRLENNVLHLDVLLPFELEGKKDEIKRELSSLGYEVMPVYDHPYSD